MTKKVDRAIAMEKELEMFIEESIDRRENKRGLGGKMYKIGYKHREIKPIIKISSGFISKW